MTNGIRLLAKLQALDETIRKLQATKSQLAQDDVDVQSRAQAAREALEASKRNMTDFRAQMDKRDGDLKTSEEKIKKLSTQLNTVKTNKEYSAIQHEILNAKAEKSGIEDDILTMMEDVDSHHQKIKECEDAAKKADEEIQNKRQAIQAAIADADARIQRIEEERTKLADTIPANLLASYERLTKGKPNTQAMAACRNFVCQGCRMSLTANTVNLLMGANKLVYCKSCGRILYLPEDEDIDGGRGAGRS